jgi:diguanylate cyclase (GGDEF)-like protein
VHIDLATVALLGALQALLLAPLLLAATRAYGGVARTSLGIWGGVLLLQALGWVLLGLRGQVGAWISVVLANGLLMASYAGTALALRLLLGVPPRRVLLAGIGLAGWLGIAWFAVVRPDYPLRVYVATLSLGLYLALLLWPLRHAARRGGSIAQRVMLLVLLTAAAGWLLRLRELAPGAVPRPGLLVATPGNVAQMIYGALEPALASIGFLLMYHEAAQAELRRLARTDPLTGTLNRLALDEELARLFRAGPAALAVLMLDVDHFKRINDRHGHAGGDRVLTALAACIGARLRAGDLLGRVGGEEFLVLLPGTGLAAALALAEALRAAVAGLRVVLDGEPQAITLSLGVAMRQPHGDDPAALVRRADRALYAAKREGRNRVAVLPPEARDAGREEAGAPSPP